MTFSVVPADLEAAAADTRTLAQTLPSAYAQAKYRLELSDGGFVYDGIAAEVGEVRSHMMAAYGEGGAIPTLLDGAATTLDALAQDYRTVDADQAARYDAMLPDTPRLSVGGGWGADEVGVDSGDLLDTVNADPEDTFTDYQEWQSVNDVGESIVKFEWLTDPLDKLGIPFDLVKEYEDFFGGDWGELGLALGTIDNIRGYLGGVSYELQGVVTRFEDSWTGDASNSCIVWFVAVRQALMEHRKALYKTCTRIQSEALAFVETLERLEDVLKDLADAFPDTSSFGGFVGSLAGGAIDAATGAVFRLVDRAWDLFQAAQSAAQVVVAGFAQLTRAFDTEWPSVPAMPTPDVDGPA